LNASQGTASVEKNGSYGIQIASSIEKHDPEEIRQKYGLEDDVYVEYKDGRYKYKVKAFESYQDAKMFLNEHVDVPGSFIR